jgi:hypothetical protein
MEEKYEAVSKLHQLPAKQLSKIILEQNSKPSKKRKTNKRIQCKFCEFIAKRDQSMRTYITRKYYN